MAIETTRPATGRPLFTGFPRGVVPYVAILAALVSAGVHLSLAPRVLQFDPTRAYLFTLAGLGFLAGIVLYVTRFWRRAYFLVAIVLALAEFVAFFVLSGRFNELAILAKSAESVFVVGAAYLYWAGRPAAGT